MKGISSLIGTVLVLLVTITAISLFSSWAPNLVQSVTDSTENQTNTAINCNEADLEILSAKYDNNNVTVVARNKGNIELNSVRLEAWDNEIPINSTTTGNLKPADLVAENISANREPTSVRAVSTQCSGQTNDRFEDIQ